MVDHSILQIGWESIAFLIAEIALHCWAIWRFIKFIDRRFLGGKEG